MHVLFANWKSQFSFRVNSISTKKMSTEDFECWLMKKHSTNYIPIRMISCQLSVDDKNIYQGDLFQLGFLCADACIDIYATKWKQNMDSLSKESLT